MTPFGQRLAEVFSQRGHLCVGIDPHRASLVSWGLPDTAEGAETFGLRLTQAAEAGGAAAIKPQSAMFERFGSAGLAALEQVLARAGRLGLLTVLDVKRGDIGSTMTAYAQAYLEDHAPLAADAITLSPYLGFGSLQPALSLAERTGRGVFVLAFTSNAEGRDVQSAVTPNGLNTGEAMIEAAGRVNAGQPPLGSTGVVIGATLGALEPSTVKLIAQLNGPILAPGVGHQGADGQALIDLFGDASDKVLATTSRAISAAGPALADLTAAVKIWVGKMAILGH
ncbi:MAG: orotidine-5'-phosphate decarboxylase [Bifidobacteriaceae bacterium]|nr:orotidine-5'-phosphate decarboxylase [Bifidobacteriaceae bacterium]